MRNIVLLALSMMLLAVPVDAAPTKAKKKPTIAPTATTVDGPSVTNANLRPIAQVAGEFLALPLTRGVAEAYSQKIAYMLPKALVPGRDVDTGLVYSIELVPAPSVPSTPWTYRMSITAYRGIGNLAGTQVAAFAKQLEQPGETCRENYVARQIGPIKLDGNDAIVMLTGCTRARLGEYVGAIEGAGEVNVMLLVRGLFDVYVIQAQLRGQPFRKDTWPISDATAMAIVNRLNPIAICAASVTTQQCVTRQDEVARGIK